MNDDKALWTYHQTSNVGNLVVGHPRQDMLCAVISRLAKGAEWRVLEIGFGDGYLLEKLSKKYKCFGADISQKNVNQMEMSLPNVSFEVIDVDGRYPYEDESFDVFVASEVLEHMSNSELKKSIEEIYRILRKGGYAVITFPAKENLKDNECFCPNCEFVFHKWGHKQYWNEEKIRDVFSDFRIEKINEFFTKYVGGNMIGRVAGLMMFILRSVANKFVSLDGKNYLVILRK